MALNKVLKFRSVWIGLAMVWIVFYHSGFPIASQSLLLLKEFGYGGVDICLFASGIGCYYSLSRDPDILRFWKRRVKRLGPAYLCFIVPWMLWKSQGLKFPFQAIVCNLLGIQTLISWDYHFNWYIGGLVIYYILAPFLKKLTDSCRNLTWDILAGLLVTAITVFFWDRGNNIIILSRLPVLYAGLVFGKLADQGYVLKKRDLIAAGILCIASGIFLVDSLTRFPDWLWSKGLSWYPFALFAPGFCIFLSWVAEKLQPCRFLRWINRFLDTVGVYSFEVYLVHIFLYESLMMIIKHHLRTVPVLVLWLGSIPAIICGTFLLNRIASLFRKLAEKIHG